MHDLTFDHRHASVEERAELGDSIWKADNVELNTVGVDIGSSTSHLMFARVHMQRLTQALSSRFVVVGREIVWRSPIILTPYLPDNLIDSGALDDFIRASYRSAGLERSDVDSGAVILTGEALKRLNARAIADLFAEESGKFVCASAGHHLESALAAHGSGAVALSRREGSTILNVDIGGGTCKLALIAKGELLQTAAIAVGGRLVATDGRGELVRVEGPALQAAEAAGIELLPGRKLTDTASGKLVKCLSDVLISHILQQRPTGLAKTLMVTARLPPKPKPEGIVFSGGVSEYIFKRHAENHHDIGAALAHSIVHALHEQRIPYPVFDVGGGIRATVIGASQFSVQVSGSTIHISNPAILPMHNLPVLRPAVNLDHDFGPALIAREIKKALRRFDLKDGQAPVALAFRWGGDPLYARLRALADGIAQGLSRSIAKGHPLVLLFDGDIGQVIGQIFRRELEIATDLFSIDGAQLQEFDYVDIGQVVRPTNVVPLVIKSLLFSSTVRHE